MQNIAKIVAALGLAAGFAAGPTWSDSAMARDGGFHGGFRGGFRGGFFPGWAYGYGYGYYGNPYAYGYYGYSYGPYGAPYDYPAGVAYGPDGPYPEDPRASRRVSAYCATPARACTAHKPGYLGARCSCSVSGSKVAGRIAPPPPPQ
jgi:hypothetical protein